jgi:hypothetical protein
MEFINFLAKLFYNFLGLSSRYNGTQKLRGEKLLKKGLMQTGKVLDGLGGIGGILRY